MDRRFFSGLLIVVIVAGLLLGLCYSPVAAQVKKGVKLAALFDGPITDKGWAQKGYEGLKKAEAEGAKIAYTDRLTVDQYVEILRNYARQGYDRVIGHSGGFMEPAIEVAKGFPKIEFVVVDGVKCCWPNITSYNMAFDEAGYLEGVLAALMTKTKKVGIVNAVEIPIAQMMVEGVRQGLKDTAPDVKFLYTATGSWVDGNGAREAAIAMIEQGADIVLTSGGGEMDVGTMTAAEDRKIMTMGLIGDARGPAPTAYLANVDIDVSLLMYLSCSTALNHKINWLGVKERIINVQYSNRVPQAIRDKVKAAEDKIRKGTIKFPR